MKKIVFIINQISGKGIGKTIEVIISEFFKEKDIDIELVFTEYAGHAKEIVSNRILDHPALIVACGGDGTINEVASALVNHSIPLGIIPIGSGNGLARNLKIPLDIHAALENILQFNLFKMDVGLFNQRYFFSNIGLGIDAKVINEYEQKKKRNFIGYFNAAIKSLQTYVPIRLKIKADQLEIATQPYFFVLCSNSNIAGYNVSFTPDAQLDDGKLDVLLVEKISFLQEVQFSFHVITKSLDQFHQAKLFQTKSIHFETNDHSILAQIDGESIVVDADQLDVSILPQALQVVVPH